MQLSDLLVGLGLLLLVEGAPWFISPNRYRNLLRKVEEVPESALRAFGLCAMGSGMALLYMVR